MNNRLFVESWASGGAKLIAQREATLLKLKKCQDLDEEDRLLHQLAEIEHQMCPECKGEGFWSKQFKNGMLVDFDCRECGGKGTR